MIWVVVGFGEDGKPVTREDHQAAEALRRMIEPFQSHLIHNENDVKKIRYVVLCEVGIMPRL